MKENGIQQSMDGKSRWADSTMIGRWFRTFKYDEVYLTEWHNIRQAREAIAVYVFKCIYPEKLLESSPSPTG